MILLQSFIQILEDGIQRIIRDGFAHGASNGNGAPEFGARVVGEQRAIRLAGARAGKAADAFPVYAARPGRRSLRISGDES